MSAGSVGNRLASALGLLHRLEDGLLALILGLMVLLAPLQILLRNFFDAGISWGDPLLRVLVLWVGMLGALAATRDRRQIGIDVLYRIAGERVQAGVGMLTGLFTSLVCGVVAYHAACFVASEIQYGTAAFGVAPTWACEIVIPVAFGLISLRYALYSVGDLRDALAGPPAEER